MQSFKFLLVAFLLFSLTFQSVYAQDNITMDIASVHTLKSSVLNEQRNILIHLPKNYQSSGKAYPVIYTLDGSGHINHVSVATMMLSQFQKIPESIVVAITNNQGTRRRDLGIERENFKKFIKEEIFSFVKTNYRTTEQRTLFGHSMAGFFTLDVLATMPDMFDHYIAASPAIGVKSSVFPKLIKLFSENKSLNKRLYFSLGSKAAEGENSHIALNNLTTLLKENAPASFNWHYQPMPFQIHMTTPYLTLYDGLSFVNEGNEAD
ncbi:MAG: putative alpha/beta superfamily hydrolase [Enterobacterales bacterium]|jgi:predicted alpha/beta superfamily hydrolase